MQLFRIMAVTTALDLSSCISIFHLRSFINCLLPVNTMMIFVHVYAAALSTVLLTVPAVWMTRNHPCSSQVHLPLLFTGCLRPN
jgi:hypothetical protein